MHPAVANTLNKIKEGYEDLLTTVQYSMASQIDYLQ